jgi:hypothetical protein
LFAVAVAVDIARLPSRSCEAVAKAKKLMGEVA